MYLNKEVKIYTSRVIDYEIDNISDGNKKRQIEDLYDREDTIFIFNKGKGTRVKKV